MPWESLLIQFPLAGIFAFAVYILYRQARSDWESTLQRERTRADQAEAKNQSILEGAGAKLDEKEEEIARLNAEMMRLAKEIIPTVIESTQAMKTYQDFLTKLQAKALNND